MNAYFLNLRHAAEGGAVSSGALSLVTETGVVPCDHELYFFTQATAGKRLVVLLHGFNVDEPDGLNSLGSYIQILPPLDDEDMILAVLWPGDSKWLGPLCYPFIGSNADDAADALFSWLECNVDASAIFAFVAHSLGSRVTMNAACRLAMPGRLKGRLERICLMAPAIDNNSLGSKGKHGYRPGTLAADRLAVLASKEDGVLHYAFPLGEFFRHIWSMEGLPAALGRTGPRETDPEVLAKLDPHMAYPGNDIGHSNYLSIDPETPRETRSKSETFVRDFVDRRGNPVWPAQNPRRS